MFFSIFVLFSLPFPQPCWEASAAKGFSPEEIQNPFFFPACQGHLSPRNQEPGETAPWPPRISRIRRIGYLTPDAADNDNRFSQKTGTVFCPPLFISEAAGSCSLQKKKIIETGIL